MNRTDDTPAEGELWLLFNQFTNSDDHTDYRLAIGRFDEVNRDHDAVTVPDDEPAYGFTYLWEATHDYLEGNSADHINPELFVYRLGDAEDFDDEYHDLLDYARGFLTEPELADLLTGDDNLKSAGREGRAALRFFALDGVSEGITETSISHGHGASRYGTVVERMVAKLPDHLQSVALESECNRWEGNMAFGATEANHIVEILQIAEDLCDEDKHDEITDLVNEFDLPYDEYIDGHFSALDCPHCGSELIERPEDQDQNGYSLLDCSECDNQYAGLREDNVLSVHHKLADSEVAQ